MSKQCALTPRALPCKRRAGLFKYLGLLREAPFFASRKSCRVYGEAIEETDDWSDLRCPCLSMASEQASLTSLAPTFSPFATPAFSPCTTASCIRFYEQEAVEHFSCKETEESADMVLDHWRGCQGAAAASGLNGERVLAAPLSYASVAAGAAGGIVASAALVLAFVAVSATRRKGRVRAIRQSTPSDHVASS